MRHVNWGLVEDEIAVDQGRLPATLVSRDERRARAMTLMVEVMQLAAKLGLGKAVLAKELGVTRISLYLWQDGSAVPGTKNYCNLLRLHSKLQKQVTEECKI
jgi:DNA-binding XRE family transcriptional regulator